MTTGVNPATGVNPVNTAQPNQNAAPVNNAQQTAGVSTLSSAANNENTGIFAQVKNLVSRFFAGISNCLSYIPLVGRLFTRYESNDGNQQQLQMPQTDAERAQQARNLLTAQVAGTAMTEADFNRIVALFNAITDPAAKNDMFASILSSPATPVELATACYNVLPANVQTTFKSQCFAANGNTSVFEGHDHGFGLGDKIVHDAILSPVAQRAATAMAAPVVVTPPPPVPTQGELLRNLMAALINPGVAITDVSAIRTAYDALNDATKNAIKAQIWYHNNRLDQMTDPFTLAVHDRSGAHGNYGHGVGAYVVGYDVRSDLMRRAVQDVILAVV